MQDSAESSLQGRFLTCAISLARQGFCDELKHCIRALWDVDSDRDYRFTFGGQGRRELGRGSLWGGDASDNTVMEFQRSSGVLLHVSSLPSYGGIGDLGPAAYEFIHFLAAAKQHIWQVLPLCPTGYGNSPYAGSSAFAGNPYLISLEFLSDWGWIEGRSDCGAGGSRRRCGFQPS